MPQFVLPNLAGGGQTLNANSLQDAEQQAQASGSWAPSAGTFGLNSLPEAQRVAAHGTGAAPPRPNYTRALNDPAFSSYNAPGGNPANAYDPNKTQYGLDPNSPFAMIYQMMQNNQLPSGTNGSYAPYLANTAGLGQDMGAAITSLNNQTSGTQGPVSGNPYNYQGYMPQNGWNSDYIKALQQAYPLMVGGNGQPGPTGPSIG